MASYSPLRRKVNRWLLQPPLALGAFLIYGLFRLLPVDAASALGARLLGAVGPLLRADRIARRNLDRAFPERSDAERAAIRRDVWDNLGRALGEWPHLNRLYRANFGGRVEIVGGDILDRARAAGGPVIVITGHHGNWELVGAACAARGMKLTVIYRPAENPPVNWLVLFARRHFTGGLLPKGKDAAAGALALLKRGGYLGVLIDQKLNEGVAVPFLGHDAMTSPVAARLALAFRCPVIPVRAERIAGARYRVTVEQPLDLPATGDRKRDQAELMLAMNQTLERWVRARPEQWFWVHRRWPD